MKAKNFILWFNLLFLSFFYSGCRSVDNNFGNDQITPTASVIASTPSEIVSSILTPGVIPTLSLEGAQTELLRMLATNGNCKLPCLWGVTPMNNSFQEAQRILAPFSILSDSVFFDLPGPINIYPRYVKDNIEIYTSIAILSSPTNDAVSRISFNIEAYKLVSEEGVYRRDEYVFNSIFFNETVSAYMLPRVLSEQGIPESVMIYTNGAPLTRGGTGGFNIALFYPSRGVFVHYTTQMNIIEKNVHGCPQSAHVWMELFPLSDTDNFFTELEKTNWQYFKNGFKPLEEVTSMSLDEFYNIFSQPTDKCIETPANLWPIPEP